MICVDVTGQNTPQTGKGDSGGPLLVPLGPLEGRYGKYGQAGILVGKIRNFPVQRNKIAHLRNFSIFKKLQRECDLSAEHPRFEGAKHICL